jgi:ATP-binding cassette, subfamily F, member 3
MLLEALAGRRELDSGRLRSGHNVKVGYLSQHGDELSFGGARTVLEACQHHTRPTPNKARALLGRFLFSGAEAEKPLDGLSGGERKRLALAILVQSGANVLILDEPTNHLDLESREALEDALRSFEGALLLVTHDRALLDAVGSRTVAIEEQRLRSYLGGWPEYRRVREERRANGAQPEAARGDGDAEPPAAAPPARPAAAATAPGAAADGPQPASSARSPSKNRMREQARLEQAVERAEAALAAGEDELGDPAHWATKYEAAKSTARHTAARRAVEDAYAALEAFESRAPA